MTRAIYATVLIIALGTMPALANPKPVLLKVDLPRTGCAALDRREDIYVSAWPADGYPGDGRPEPAEYRTKSDAVSLRLMPGYYRVMYSTRHCWEAFQNVVLLPSHQREIAVKFATWVASGHTDYFMYYAPIGAVAGLIPPGIDRLALEPASPISKRTAQELYPQLTEGAFYFDSVPVGRYRLHIHGLNGDERRDVIVQKDGAQIINLSPSDDTQL